MKVLGISGSPRRGGNSEVLLDKALAGAEEGGAEVVKVVLNVLSFKPCQECGGCKKEGVCVLKDDMEKVYKELETSDGVILASPIFFGSLSAQTKAMIDRCQALWVRKKILGVADEKRRKGSFIAVSATGRKDFFANAKSIVQNFFATIGAEYTLELFAPKVDEKGAILNHPDVLEKAYVLGKNIAK